MSTSENLKKIAAKNKANQLMGPSQVKERQAKDLYNRMLEYQRVAEEAPGNAANAERMYYTFVDGDYDNKALRKTAHTVEAQLQQNHDKLAADAEASIANYQSQLIYRDNLDALKSELSSKRARAGTMREKQLAESTTNRQRVMYINQEYETLNNVEYVVFLFAVGLVGVMCYNTYTWKLWQNPKNPAVLTYLTMLLSLIHI